MNSSAIPYVSLLFVSCVVLVSAASLHNQARLKCDGRKYYTKRSDTNLSVAADECLEKGSIYWTYPSEITLSFERRSEEFQVCFTSRYPSRFTKYSVIDNYNSGVSGSPYRGNDVCIPSAYGEVGVTITAHRLYYALPVSFHIEPLSI